MIHNEMDTRQTHLMDVAQAMMTAARTAPKAKGNDLLVIKTITGEDIKSVSDKLTELSPILNHDFFMRDAQNILQAEAIVLIGTQLGVQGLNCGYCGSPTCEVKSVEVPCFFPIHDLGLAVGSAAAIAADNRVDSRVMYSVGAAAMSLGMMKGCHAVTAIPISCTGKNPFFDRVHVLAK